MRKQNSDTFYVHHQESHHILKSRAHRRQNKHKNAVIRKIAMMKHGMRSLSPPVSRNKKLDSICSPMI